MTTTAPTRRINHGRGHSYLLDGERADGITWILGNGVPKPALVNWAARESAGYAVDHWDELQTVGASERLRRIERARFENLKAVCRFNHAPICIAFQRVVDARQLSEYRLSADDDLLQHLADTEQPAKHARTEGTSAPNRAKATPRS